MEAVKPSTTEPKPGDTRAFGGIEFVWIPPGEFRMGSPDSEDGRTETEGPVHRVRITKGFWMGKYPVTQEQYQRVMGENPSEFRGSNHPVDLVTWRMAVKFCRELSRQGGATYRLPTEAEWEYACRAGTSTRYYWGDSCDETVMMRYCWYEANAGMRGTQPVGQKLPNGFGLYDMSGNVYEWCSDWYRGSYYRIRPDVDLDPAGPGVLSAVLSACFRVNRGGSWCRSARFCRSANRSVCSPGHSYNCLGLRVVAIPAASE